MTRKALLIAAPVAACAAAYAAVSWLARALEDLSRVLDEPAAGIEVHSA